MAGSRGLALISWQASLASIPPETLVLPLRPDLVIPRKRLVATRPEDLLTAKDLDRIGRDSESVVSSWIACRFAADALAYRGVGLAPCFSYGIRMIAVDLLKTIRIVEAAREHAPGRDLYTDAGTDSALFPPYPYLSAVGSILEQSVRDSGGTFHGLRAPERPQGRKAPGLARVYSGLAARQGATRLKKPDVLIALGPYPEDYRPVAREWKAGSGETVVVAPRATPVRASAADGLAFLALESLVDRATRMAISTFVDHAAQGAQTLDLEGPLVQGALDLRPILRGDVERRLRRNLVHLAMMGEAFETRFEKVSRLLVMETVSPLAHAAVLFAQRHGIPSTVLQHGVVASAISYRQTKADRIATWGPADREWFEENLAGTSRSEATGSPRYDRLATAVGAATKPIPGLPTDRPMVVFVSQPFVQDDAARSAWARWEALQMALAAAGSDTSFRLVVKWHPAEEPEPLPSPGMETVARAVRAANTLALLRASRVVLAVSSTAALEAMYLERPVVFLGPPDPKSPFHPPEDGGGLRALNVEQLSPALGRLIPDGADRDQLLASQRSFLASHYAPLDGNAATRVATLLRGG